jgi:isoleucyl-tRNA synthetase
MHVAVLFIVQAEKREAALRGDLQQLYNWQLKNNTGEMWTLHDGPPYANGSVHIGHALNKILKDITNRFKIQTGHRVHYIPGWDCHGLPIEQKALKSLDQKLSPNTVRQAAKKFAEKEIANQMTAFQSWGVIGGAHTIAHAVERFLIARLARTLQDNGSFV